MTKAHFIIKNYARALFKGAKKDNSLEVIVSELSIFKKVFNSDFAYEIDNPTIAKADLVEIFKEIAKKNSFSNLLTGFLVAMAENRRLDLFSQVHEEFLDLIRKEGNILVVELITTGNLGNTFKDNIRIALEKKYSGQKIELKETVKKEILGGFLVKIGSKVLDASLNSQIDLLAKECRDFIN